MLTYSFMYTHTYIHKFVYIKTYSAITIIALASNSAACSASHDSYGLKVVPGSRLISIWGIMQMNLGVTLPRILRRMPDQFECKLLYECVWKKISIMYVCMYVCMLVYLYGCSYIICM